MFLIFDIETMKNMETYLVWARGVQDKGLDPIKEFPPPITHKLCCLGYLAVTSNYELFCYGAIPDRWSGLAGTY